MNCRLLAICVLSFAFGACDHVAAPTRHASKEEPTAPTNRVAIPASVRENLGITFARVEKRAVTRTLRMPGRFEELPQARREYHALAAGRVELLVNQYDVVQPEAPLYRLDAPEWRALQQQLNDTELAIVQANSRVSQTMALLTAHEEHERNLRESVELWTGRIAKLDEIHLAGGGRGEELSRARASLLASRAELSELLEKDLELEYARADAESLLSASRLRLELLLNSAAVMLGVSRTTLLETLHNELGEHSHWRCIPIIEVRALAAGIVESVGVTNGGWADSSELVLATVAPDQLRFSARGLQSDLGRLRDGLPALIVPPQGGSIALADSLPGVLKLGLSANPHDRTIDLLVTPTRLASWARAGVAAHLEVTVEGDSAPQLAVPLTAVIHDGLSLVLFRRDPKDPNFVIRMEADAGIDDGRWIAIESGVKEGDEVVLDGIYQLMLASSGTNRKGGHFHSDGTFHAGEEEE
ncbi:MAG: efflux RND transporter periplasmic adaptor subunit [Planctomycetota bacterium]